MTVRRGAAATAVEWLLALAALVPFAFLPLARDQGHFAYAGQVVLDGGLPYRDVFDQKGPATHYTYALALALFGQTQFAVRFFFLLVALLGTRLAAALGERLAGAAARLPCALCYALVVLQGDGDAAWHTAQVEDLILFFQLLVLWAIGSETGLKSRWRTCLAGALMGLTCTYKPTALLPSAALGVAAVVSLPRATQQKMSRARWLLSATSGFLLPPLVGLAWFAWHGALDDFWSVVVEFNLAYVGRRYAVPAGLAMLATRWGSLVALASWGAVSRRLPQAVPLDRLLWALLLGNLAAVVWQQKFWAYHWTPMIGCLAIFAGVSVAHVAEAWRLRCSGFVTDAGTLPGGAAARRGLPRFAGGLGGAALILGLPLVAAPVDAVELGRMWRELGQVAAGHRSLDEFRGRFECGAAKAEVHRQVAEYVAERTAPNDALLVWGYETLVNFLANRRAPSRFAVDRILCLDKFPRQAQWREEFLAALAERPPAYILVVEHDGTTLWRDSAVELDRFEALRGLVARDYAEEAQIDRFRIYRRIAPPLAGLPAPYRRRL